jgi:hypothetical protein
MNKVIIPIGEKLFHLDYGTLEVRDYKDGFYYFRNNEVQIHEKSNYLSLTQYTLQNGGFTPLSDYNKPQKFDVGYFWIDESHHELTYSQLIDIREDKFINSGFAEWNNFSKEVPEWFTKRINPKF